nr:hypothetical protein [Tanacetum cinerariifolium]
MAPKKAAPKRTTRLNPGATSNPNQAPSTTTTTVTNAQLQAMIDQGVNAALAAHDANRTGDDSHTSGTGVRRTEHDGDGFSHKQVLGGESGQVCYMYSFGSPYEGRTGDVSLGVDGPPVMPEDPYAYVAAAFQALPPPDYPLPASASPTTESLRYIPESDMEEDDDEDPEEDPADYPADLDDEEEEEEPSGDDVDEEDKEQDEDLLSSGRRADRPEVTLPPQKRLSIVHFLGYEAGESLVADAARPIEGRRADYGFVDSVEAELRRRRAEDIRYGIRDTWIDLRDVAEEEALTTLEGVNTRVTELVAVQEQDTQDIYGVMEDTQATLTTHLSSLQGHLATALGEIRALQAREQARAGAPEGASSST